MNMVNPAEKNKDGYLMRVSASTPPQSVANSIARSIFDESKFPMLRAVGAGAVAQTCKGIAIARGIVAPKGLDLACTIGFDTVTGDNGQDISAQTFYLHPR